MSHHISDDTTEFGRASGLRMHGERLGYLIQSSRPPAGPHTVPVYKWFQKKERKKEKGGNRSVITDSSVSTDSLFDVVLVVSWLPG